MNCQVKTFLLILILGICSYDVMAQKMNKEENLMELVTPLDSVPEWVQKRVTPEEYRLWKTMSSIFKINYSFLNRNFPLAEREIFYRDIKRMCDSIENGEYSNKKGELFSVSLLAPIDATVDWKVSELIQIDDNIQFCKRSSIIYRCEEFDKAYLECSVWYIYNYQKKDINIVKYEILSPTPFSRFQGSVSFFLQDDRISLKGNCSGTIEFYDDERNYHSETVYKSFIVPLFVYEDKN